MRVTVARRSPAAAGLRRTGHVAGAGVLAGMLGLAITLTGCEGRVADRVGGATAEQEEPQQAEPEPDEQTAAGDSVVGDGAGDLDPEAVASVERAVQQAEDAVASVDQELEED